VIAESAASPLSGLWPSQDQILLLRAALSEKEEAHRAFARWVEGVDLDAHIDQGTFRLLPLLYDNLRRVGVDHPLMGRLKGVYRLAWYKNHCLFERVRPVVAALHDAGIPTMMLKGVPLVLAYYRNHALRPMADIDLLVPASQARRALDMLERIPLQHYAPPTDDYLKFRHALLYTSDDGREIDLHWHALYEFCEDGADDLFWNSARALDFNGVSAVMPDPTRMLFHTIVHGVRWNDEPPIRWIPDAITILRVAGKEIAWDDLVEHARERQVAYRLRLGLEFLRQTFDTTIPDRTVGALRVLGTSPIQRVENTSVLRDQSHLRNTPLGMLWLIFSEYCRYARHEKPFAFAVGFTHYLRFRWELRGRLEIPGVVMRGTLKRLRRARTPASAETGE
jgi:hypothetical protein